MIGDVATGEAAERSIGAFTRYRGGITVSRNGISNQEDQCVDASHAINAAKDTRAKGSRRLVPLDLALYSRKNKAGGTTSAVPLSASEKIANSRKFLLELAGQDPGDAHEALSLDSCYERPSHVVVSDDFLDKVGWPAELNRGLFSAVLRDRVVSPGPTGCFVRLSLWNTRDTVSCFLKATNAMPSAQYRKPLSLPQSNLHLETQHDRFRSPPSLPPVAPPVLVWIVLTR